MKKRWILCAVLVSCLSACSQTPIPAPEVKAPPQQPVAPLINHLIFFEWDKDIPPEDVSELIRPHAKYLVQNPSTKILIEGAADETGNAQYNIALGMRRAQVIGNHFIAQGVDQQQLIIRSIGVKRPLNLEGKPHSLARNRRVTLVY